MNPSDPADVEGLKRLLRKLPDELKWEIVQFACGLSGRSYWACDATDAFIALIRGDLLGENVSIIPIEEVAKLARLPMHRAAFGKLLDLARKDTELTRVLERGMAQLRDLVGRFPKGRLTDLDGIRADITLSAIRADIARYFETAQAVRRLGRGLPGTAVGGESLKYLADPLKLLYCGDRILTAFRLPRQIADKLRDHTFPTFGALQQAVWRAIGHDPQVGPAFAYDPANLERMKHGRAALVPKAPAQDLRGVEEGEQAPPGGDVPDSRAEGELGGMKGAEESFTIHHATPIHDGGGVYDLDNLIICMPQYHGPGVPPSEYPSHKGDEEAASEPSEPGA